MSFNLSELKNDLKAARQGNQADADAAWNELCDKWAEAFDKYIRSGEYNYVASPQRLVSTSPGQPVSGTFKVQLT
jgi:hypothetical protein